MAVRQGDRYVVHGQTVWITTAQVAHKMLLLARTTRLEDVSSPTEGLSLFYTNLDRNFVGVREIEKMARKAVDSNEVFIDGLPITAEDLIGEQGKGFRQTLYGLNPERILVAGECIGIARNALARAAHYANERVILTARSAKIRVFSIRSSQPGRG
ncbi:MAG: acyl-CoA/acyl-ACP dehydrogenase [Sneathiella sp.]|nr:acyl-CoA/acyl-ACP dehydrogenase [Sneathiella sp.]